MLPERKSRRSARSQRVVLRLERLEERLLLSNAPVLCPATGHYYELVLTSGLSWQAAETAAAAMSYQGVEGHLVTLTTKAENDFLANNMLAQTGAKVWIGAYKSPGSSDPSANWHWVTGEQWSYTNWFGSNPDNAGGNEDNAYTSGIGTRQWDDVNGSTYQVDGYVVEFDGPFGTQPVMDVDIGSTLSVHSFDFGGLPTGASASQQLTIHNQGTSSLTVTQAAGLSAPFSISPTNGPGSGDDWTIAAGATQSFTVSFAPTAFGESNATLTLSSNDPYDPSYAINLTGAGSFEAMDPVSGHWYELVPASGITWESAQSAAASQSLQGVQGHLATITTQAESDFITSQIVQNASGHVWVGGYKSPDSANPAVNWHWVTGEPWNFTNWDSGQPDNNGPYGQEDWLDLLCYDSGRWNDESAIPDASGYVVEYDTVNHASGVSGYAIQTLASFNGANGSSPRAGLIMDGSGNLYGTTKGGGANGDGTVFEIEVGSNTITTLGSFDGTNGSEPLAGLIVDASGNLYGTTYGGGDANGDGTVFEIAAGSNTITTVASFNGSNGSRPWGGVIMEGSGNLYGTTELGGANTDGTMFEIAAGGNTITTLASFSGTNGSYPVAGLILDGSGNLYGTTYGGGDANGHGTVFEIETGTSTITTLASFDGTNGSNPYGGLIRDSGGNLYGTTGGGGANNDGTVFELSPAVLPTQIGQWTHGPMTVTAYDTVNPVDVNPSDIKVVFGNNDTVNSIRLSGSEPMTGLGLVISGANSVGAILDARTGSPGAISFIASEAPISVLSVKTGASGYALDGLTLGGVTFGDLDGNPSDLTALYCKGARSVAFGGSVTGDLVFDGVNAHDYSLGTLLIGAGGLNGELYATGSGASVTIDWGDLDNVNIGGSLGSLTVFGGNTDGTIAVADNIGSMLVQSAGESALGSPEGGTLGGTVTAGGWIQTIRTIGGDMAADVTAGQIGTVTVLSGDLTGQLDSTALPGGLFPLFGIRSVKVIGGDIADGSSITSQKAIQSIQAFQGRSGGGSIGGTIVSGRDIWTIDANGGSLTATVSAARLGNVLTRDGDLSGSLTSTEAPADLGSAAAIGTVRVIGGDLSGVINANGRINLITVSDRGNGTGDISAGAQISTQDRLSVLQVQGGILGGVSENVSISADSVGVIQVGGDVDNAQLTFSAVPGLRFRAVGVMQVGGALDASSICSAGDIGFLSVQTMQDSLVYAGVNGAASGLPDPTTDFTEDATISVLRVRGAVGGADSFINSDVAAYNLGNIRLSLVQTDNGGAAFGVAAHDYYILVFSDATGQKVFRNSATVPADGDFQVLLG